MVIPICWDCRHYRTDASCSAFPDGIPAEILDSEADHRRPYPGDRGIRFELKKQELTGSARITAAKRPA
jgi:hypothetical protein